MVWFVVALVLVALLGAAFVYDRRRGGKVRGDSASRERDLGRSVEHDNGGLERKFRGGPGY